VRGPLGLQVTNEVVFDRALLQNCCQRRELIAAARTKQEAGAYFCDETGVLLVPLGLFFNLGLKRMAARLSLSG
jgi:hypothetical protein